ncbi:hypothetical protein Hdeb2414_s0007g00256191 [Helianthus debilis subsp. tardiflorus]
MLHFSPLKGPHHLYAHKVSTSPRCSRSFQKTPGQSPAGIKDASTNIKDDTWHHLHKATLA